MYTNVSSQDITGLWSGTLYNDSTQQTYQYEIAISDDHDKLNGYSHTWFLLEDKRFYGVKKVKIRQSNGKIIIEDNGLIANNYPVAPAKKVRQLNVLTLEIKDSILILSGPFTTNATKEYRPLTGYVTLTRKNDYWKSDLVPHLKELGRDQDLSFVPKQIETSKPEPKNKLQIDNKSPGNLSLNNKAPLNNNNRVSVLPAAEVNMRKTVVQETVFFKSDSLQIALYDNGEVDGDTVSVLMNGKIFLANERLGTKAIKKTIHVDHNTDKIELVMYAENLGSIPPNTGLMVIRDGKDIYEVRFSGDLQQNASIIFIRKKS